MYRARDAVLMWRAEDKTMQRTLGMVIGGVLVWANLVLAAAGVELFTAPLPVFADTETPQCLAPNVAGKTLDVTLSLFTDGVFAGGSTNNALTPLRVHVFENLAGSGRITCRLTSAAGRPGDFMVTLCTMDRTDRTCKVAVTAQ
jgi:hypothetical protein